MRKKISILIMFMMLCLPMQLLAASGNLYLSASKTTLYIGETTTITTGFNASEISAVEVGLSNSNPSVLSGGRSIISYNGGGGGTSGSESFTFTAKSLGSTTISIRPNIFETVAGENVSVSSKSVTIQVIEKQSSSTQSSASTQTAPSYSQDSVATPNQELRDPINVNDTLPQEKSSNSKLASLTVENAIQPVSLQDGVYDYQFIVPANTVMAMINAKAVDENATIEGIQTLQLEKYITKHAVVVKAEDGSTSTYNLIIEVEQNPKTKIKNLSDQEIEVYDYFKEALPGYTDSEMNINDVAVKVLKNDRYTLVYTKEGMKYFENEKLHDYVELKFNDKVFTLAPLKDSISGMKIIPITLQDKIFHVYTYTQAGLDNFVVLPLISDNQEVKLYQYEKNENTLQLFANNTDELKNLENKLKTQQANSQTIIYALIGSLSFLIIGIIGYILFKVIKLKKSKSMK